MITLARHAMATRFELILHGPNPVSLRAAGEAALDEIDRVEAQLSLYRASSEIAHVNARAAHEAVRVTPAVFSLLEHARRLNQETKGAFDITIAPLVRCWGFMNGTGRMPLPSEIARARSVVGMHLVQLDPERLTVRFLSDGVMLDLGAIGKGYAIDQAVETLREAGITHALLHGGTSTVFGLGTPPDAEHWAVAIENPFERDRPFTQVNLKNESLSVSAIRGRSFEADGKIFGHVIDSRNGLPVSVAELAAVILPCAMETDALSTGLLTLGLEGVSLITRLHPGMRALVVGQKNTQVWAESRGIDFPKNRNKK
jgi:FAD:protein FMN transferase